jgi:hypothetical protein
MSRTVAEETEIKIVGKSGQISLGKRYAGKMLRLGSRADGSVVLTAVAVVPENQHWTLKEPHRSRIERGLAWAAEAAPRETNIESLMKRFSPRAGRPRGRRAS